MEMKKKISLLLIVTLIASMLLVGCGSSDLASGEEDRLTVAVTIVPQAAFVEAICGDMVDVVTMVPPGNSPANYEPTPEETAKFQDADIYFAIGVPTEEANIYDRVSEDTKLVKLQDDVAAVYPDRTFEDGGRDPHTWLSTKRVKVMLDVMTEELSLLDEENREIYEANKEAYVAQLDALEVEMATLMEGTEGTSIIMNHPSFGYLADDYGLNMLSLEEHGKEATPQHLQELTDFALENNIHSVFYQAEVAGEQVAAFAEGIDAEVVQLSPLAPNYIENMTDMLQKIVNEVVK
jgi:zinc transport system substrate-binding protein